MLLMNKIVESDDAMDRGVMVNKAIVNRIGYVNNAQRGVALLESLIALLIFSMGILAIVGLQGFMVKASTESRARSEATFLAQNRIAMVWAHPENIANYAEPKTDIAGLAGWSRETEIDGLEVKVTITWRQPGEDEHHYTAIATVAGG